MRTRLHSTLLAALSCAVLTGYWGWSTHPTTSWGWDETMHAALPATRMSFAIEEGLPRRAFSALLACERYPFAFPVVLACHQLVFGASERGARLLVTALWGLTLFGVFLLGRRVGGAVRERDPPAEAVAWLALALGATCPLAVGFAGTVFLEVPFACAMVFGLLAWLRRPDASNRPSERRRDLLAGAAIALSFFTKFNYGLLFVAGVWLDWLLQGIAAHRGGDRSAFWRRTGWLAIVPVAVLAWWFVFPLPGGPAIGESHREAFWLWIRGNQERHFTPWKVRFFHLLTYLAPTTRLALVECAGVLLALRLLASARARATVRALACVLGVMGGVILVHTMHLDRFWIPPFVALWVLAATGLISVLPGAPARRGIALALLGVVTLAFPRADLPIVADRLAVVPRDPHDPEGQARRLAGLRGRLRLDGARLIPSTGLPVDENRALLDLIALGVSDGDRVGSIGITDWLSTSAVHFGLWERGGPPLRYVEQAARVVDLTTANRDPGISDARLLRFAAPFDVLLGCDPSVAGRVRRRAFLARYRERLVELGWRQEVLGSFSSGGDAVRVYALRKSESGD